jgi:hypothetical protein
VKPVQVLSTVFWAKMVEERTRRMKTNMFAKLEVLITKGERQVGAPQVIS